MIDLEAIIKRIEESGVEEITTKELKEDGLNDYYIKKALQEEKLEKIGRGKYKITQVTKEKIKKASDYFKKFTRNILNKNFSEAYDNLYNSMINQVNHNYDNHLVLYFTLLKEILGNEKDFTFLDNLDNLFLVGEKAHNTDSYYQDYINFSEAVLSHDFEKAYYSSIKFRNEEKQRRQSNNISTLLFSILTENVMAKTRKNKKQEEQNEKEINDRKNYNIYHNNFYKNIEENNYEEALENLYKLLPYYRLNMKDLINNLIKVIKTYLEIKENKQPLPVITKKMNYNQLRDTKIILNTAIEKGDFKTAQQTIERCLDHNPNNIFFTLYRTLLQKIMDQDKQNKEELKEDKIKEQPKIEEIPKMEVTPKKEPEIHNYNIKELIELIYDREYEKVQAFLEECLKNEDNRTYSFALKLIKKMNNIKNSEKVFQKEIPDYQNNQNNPFKRFFEALKYSDYEEALEMATICEEIAHNPEEFTIYRYIIEDILETIKLIEENNIKKETTMNLNTKIGNFTNNINLTEDNISQLEDLIEKKAKLCSENEIIYNDYYLEMIDILKSIKEQQITANDFEHFTYDEKDIEKRFFKALSQGDYKEALNLMNSEEWFQKTNDSPNIRYFPLYRNLLINIKRQLNKNELTMHLKAIRSLIEKEEYEEAYLYYQQNNIKGISKDLNQELKLFFTFTTKEKEDLTTLYKKAYARGDFDKTEQYLKELESWIDCNGSLTNIDYYRARLSSLRQEVTTEDFVIKEQLYDTARYYFTEKNYEKTIELLNEYIEKDKDLSAKGYLLRGRAKEQLRQYEEAKADYQKTLSIIPEPNAFHRLGKIHLYNKECEQALEYFLEYENRRPNRSNENLYALSATYKTLGKNNLSEKYMQMIKRHPKNRK